MIVIDAAMGWMLGGAVGGIALIVLLARQRARRRQQRDEIRMPGESGLGAASLSGPSSVQPLASVSPWTDSRMAAGPVTLPPSAAPAPAAQPARSADAIRAEIAAHAERLASARAARAAKQAASLEAAEVAAQQAAQEGARAAMAASARPAAWDRGADAGEDARPVFDPTRSTPWQQVVESVARARYGEPAAPTPASTPAGAAGRVVPIKSAAGAAAAVTVQPVRAARDGQTHRVLVADDARVVRVKLQRLLSAQGWEVIEAGDGEEALRLLASHRPDLLITDVDMPGLDGFALTRAVRAEPDNATLPVIMITAADDEHREEASRAGVSILLGKPYGEAALLAHMRRLMGLKPATPVVTVAAETVAA